MPKQIRWGVLGAASIAVEKVIPAMQAGRLTDVVAIASRDITKAQTAADALGIEKAYGSYEALLADPTIDAVYNPLPNHLHEPWTRAAAEAGKHVLCEKPIGLTADEARALIAVRDRTGVKIQEAFMVRTHPQWLRTIDMCRSGQLGELRSYVGTFSYFNDDPDNIRNVAAWGGGALMDIGCYLIVTSRMVFGEEPTRVLGLIDRDPTSGVDTLTSMVLDFPSGQATGVCGTQMAPYQRVQLFGTKGRLEVEIPFNAPPDRPCRLRVDATGDLQGRDVETIEIPTCDQYQIQGDLFSQAILEDTDVAYPLEMSVANMMVIEAVFRSAETGQWEKV
ncbi:MAG: Gfo/Idh/MocA family oxidoreductase [Acidobacteria bacterium]|jgi:predicted dehydrogenase|nr:Gfo/Idh/MocA family oxidoreductase [Acidobacteriota bacterium]